MQTLGISRRLTVSKSLMLGPRSLYLHKPFGCFWCPLKFESHCVFFSFYISGHLPIGYLLPFVELMETEICKQWRTSSAHSSFFVTWHCWRHTLEMLHLGFPCANPSLFILFCVSPVPVSFLDSFSPLPLLGNHMSCFGFHYNNSDDFQESFTSADSFSSFRPIYTIAYWVFAFWISHGTLKSTWLNGARDLPPTPGSSPLSHTCVDGAAIHPVTTSGFPLISPTSMNKPCWSELLNMLDSVIAQENWKKKTIYLKSTLCFSSLVSLTSSSLIWALMLPSNSVPLLPFLNLPPTHQPHCLQSDLLNIWPQRLSFLKPVRNSALPSGCSPNSLECCSRFSKLWLFLHWGPAHHFPASSLDLTF